ncbi:MAG: helix-turn-helix transcriptional regulator [Candidatus Aenigmarchaeota archaeon]|nr:helix-turn-helix transcriptional regulator [Candidatus Aenigmarchaeota archaeon]
MSKCPVFDVAGLVGKKWTIALIQEVDFYGNEGFNSLFRRMGKISPKVLTMRLRGLERRGIIERAVNNGGGLERTSYRLTGRGRELQGIISSLKKWNSANGETAADCYKKECAACAYY